LAASGAAGAGAPADTDLAKPADAAAAGETSAPANGTAAEVSPSAGTEKPAETPAAPDSVVPTAAIPASAVPVPVVPTPAVPAPAVPASAAETQPRPESPSELAAKSERGPVPKVAIPAVPPLPPPALKLPDKPEPRRSARGPEITINVIRSRGRWRVLGVCMTLLVMGLVALLAAWRFVPNRVPPRLRPAQLMMSLGIQALPTTATAVRRAPPEAQFDE
jgi:hypothetical protein